MPSCFQSEYMYTHSFFTYLKTIWNIYSALFIVANLAKTPFRYSFIYCWYVVVSEIDIEQYVKVYAMMDWWAVLFLSAY